MRTEQLAVSVLMGYATFIAVKCPCRKVLSCHLEHFFISTLLAQSSCSHTMFDVDFAIWAEREYSKARIELSRLEALLDEVRWYHSEVVGFQTWKPPWFQSFPGSLVQLHGTRVVDRGFREIDTY